MGRWKGVKLAADVPLELYDLSTDLAEANDIASSNRCIVEQIEAIIKTARTESQEFPIHGS